MSIKDAELDPPEVEKWLFARSGELAFDVGGNTGRVAAHLATKFATVVSMEPAVESFAKLALIPGVNALNVAVSDRAGSVQLAVQADHIKSGQLTSPNGGGEEWLVDRSLGGGGWGEILGSREVPCVTLDMLAAQFGDPDFIKIDVEGHETRVVAGGLALFERARPAFYIEVHNAELGAGIRQHLDPLYPDIQWIKHPYYKPTDFGANNHFWLVSE